MIDLRLLKLLAAYPSLSRATRLAPEELRTLQWQRLTRLLTHAHARSPFYRRQFAAVGAEPGDIRSLADFARLPLTTRADLRAPDDILVEGLTRERLRSSTSSGSTGQPTRTYFDAQAWVLAKHLLKLRARRACGVQIVDRLALFQEEVRNEPPGRFARVHAFTVHQPPRAIVASVVRFAPTILYGFPGYLVRLGEVAAGRIRPRLVFTSSELLDGWTRRRLYELFDAPVLDIYGCAEVKEIAWQCARGDTYHLNSDWLLFETVVPAGEAGHGIGSVVVTPLFNYAMPLLRYEIGDTAEIVDGLCPCGLGLPLVRPVFGREVDYFRLADGEVITPYDLTCAIERVPGMLRYQIVQRSMDRVEVRVVPGSDFDERSQEEIRSKLRGVLHGLDARICLVERVENEPSGKFRIVKSELSRAAAQSRPS